jgi:hypothetical protein
MPSPSVTAQYSYLGQYATEVATGDHPLMMHRPYQLCVAPEIMDPILAEFVFSCEHLEPSEVHVAFANDLIEAMSQVFSSEQNRAASFSSVFRAHGIGIEATTISRDGKPSVFTDASYQVHSSQNVFSALVLNVEVKNELCRTNQEPMLENAAYFCQYWAAMSRTDIRRACLCPGLLLHVLGPYLSASVAVFYADRVVVKPVTPLIPMLRIPGSNLEQSLVRLVGAVSVAVSQLSSFYLKLFSDVASSARDPMTDLQEEANQHFPFPKSFSVDSDLGVKNFELRYLQAHPNMQVFEGEVIDPSFSEKRVFVKFCTSYSSALHTWVFAANAAPRLISLQQLRTHFMVVMAPIPPEFHRLHEVKKTVSVHDPRLHRCFICASALVSSLHAAGLVHGDLRDVNLFVDLEQGLTMLLDFDWGGSVDQRQPPRYPMCLNPAVQWPPGARAGALIKPEHDVWCLKDAFTKE